MAKVTEVTLAQLGSRKRSEGDALAILLCKEPHIELVGPRSFRLDDGFKDKGPWLDTNLPRTTHGRDTLWLLGRHIVRYEMLTWACTPTLHAYSYPTSKAALEAFAALRDASETFQRMLRLK